MTRYQAAVVLAAILATACQPFGPDEVNEPALRQARAAERVQLPVIPVGDLGPNSIWPLSGSRRYVVVTTLLSDTSQFVAYGVQDDAYLPALKLVFLIQGSISEQLAGFLARLDADGAQVVLFPQVPPYHPGPRDTNALLEIYSGQVGSSPPTDPPGVMVTSIVRRSFPEDSAGQQP